MNEYDPPYTLKEFYACSMKYKCEELVDYVIAVYRYQEDYELANRKPAVIIDASQANQTPVVLIDASQENSDDVAIKDHRKSSTFLDKTKNLVMKLSGRLDNSIKAEIKDKSAFQTKSNTALSPQPEIMEENLAYIINKYIRSTSPKQINIPFHITDNLIKNYQNNIRGPVLFEESLKHCEMILKTSLLPNFNRT
jgi:hypothetical protein